MKLRDLLVGYSNEIKRITQLYGNEFNDNPDKKIQGFMNDSSNVRRIISFDIHNDVVENLPYLLQISTKVRDIYFEGRCKISHIPGKIPGKRTLTICKDSNISKDVINEMCIQFEDSYEKLRTKKLHNATSFNSPAPVVLTSSNNTNTSTTISTTNIWI